ncbi:hypothetical protein Thiowin_02935 [Thiorhodovibrio winogradskyi]|uniref:Uncharacterized protein n=1 Tax=Thiorhodovibrio winogradskyi TaxID=77007 RepID=A0ABZ0SCQ2_9GAMM
MSDEALRKANSRGFWMVAAVCLLPLLPYAMHAGS